MLMSSNPTGLSPESGAIFSTNKDFTFEMINCSLLHHLFPLEEEQPRVRGKLSEGVSQVKSFICF